MSSYTCANNCRCRHICLSRTCLAPWAYNRDVEYWRWLQYVRKQLAVISNGFQLWVCNFLGIRHGRYDEDGKVIDEVFVLSGV